MRPDSLWIAMALLMLAAVIRIPAFAYTGDHLNPFFLASEALTIVALVYATERMIGTFGGASGLYRLDFAARMMICGRVFIPMTITCLTFSFVSQLLGDLAGWEAFDGSRIFLRGIDGIAFDQMTDAGRVFSATLAGVLMLFVIERGQRVALSLRRVGVLLLPHVPYLLAGICLASLFLLGLTAVQDHVRQSIMPFIRGLDSVLAKNAIIVLFAGGFASLRLLAIVTIFTLAFRASFRRNAAAQ